MPELSPQAQAVRDAYFNADGFGYRLAAALRAVANDWRVDTEFIGGVEYIRTSTLDAIAAELEGVTSR